MNSTVKRTIFGVLFLAVMLGGLLFNKYLFLVLFSAITGGLVHEFLKLNGISRNAGVSVLGALFFAFCWALCFGIIVPDARLVIAVVCAFGVMAGICSLGNRDLKSWLATASSVVYIMLPVAILNFLALKGGEFDGRLILALFIIVWSSDVGAYCFGMLLGQKLWPAKLCPEISPKKSWAGAIGGMLSTLLAAYLVVRFRLIGLPLVHVLVMSVLMNVAGVCGDLFESVWKRAVGVKDSGNVIPGHGGLLDRFDAALFAMPIAFLYLLVFELV